MRVFVDFDGTITTQDVGSMVFRSLGGAEAEEAIVAYRAGVISARECFLRAARAIGSVELKNIEELVDAQRVDPGFKDFVQFCNSHDVELCVLSDGLDYSLERILTANGMSGIVRFSNVMTMTPVDFNKKFRMQLEFPHENPECDRCACCVRNVMLTRSGDEDFIVYVGEGYSGRCPSGFADLVFAKDQLQSYCQQENISYLPYRTFFDVESGVKRLLLKKHLRPRHRAALQRAATFIAE